MVVYCINECQFGGQLHRGCQMEKLSFLKYQVIQFNNDKVGGITATLSIYYKGSVNDQR